MVGPNENNTVQLSKCVGSFAILMRISPKAVAHCTRAALWIMFIVAFHLGCSRRCDDSASMLGSGCVVRYVGFIVAAVAVTDRVRRFI